MTQINKLSAQDQFASSIHIAMDNYYKQAMSERIKMGKLRNEKDCAKGRCIVKNCKVYYD